MALTALALERAPAPRIVFVDLDRTLIVGYSIAAFAVERLRQGTGSARSAFAQARAYGRYLRGRADFSEVLSVCCRDLAGESEAALSRFGEQVFDRRLKRSIYPQARAMVRSHQQAGRHVVMVTSASRFQAAPIAGALGISEICCTELEAVDGLLTGNAAPCFGEGKLRAALRVCIRLGVDLEETAFYSDSTEDLPLLEAVGEPIAVNPKPALRRHAEQRGWLIHDYEPPLRDARRRRGALRLLGS